MLINLALDWLDSTLLARCDQSQPRAEVDLIITVQYWYRGNAVFFLAAIHTLWARSIHFPVRHRSISADTVTEEGKRSQLPGGLTLHVTSKEDVRPEKRERREGNYHTTDGRRKGTLAAVQEVAGPRNGHESYLGGVLDPRAHSHCWLR